MERIDFCFLFVLFIERAYGLLPNDMGYYTIVALSRYYGS